MEFDITFSRYASDQVETWFGPAPAILFLAVIAILVLLFLAALVSILRTPGLGGIERLIWLIAILFLQVIGPLAWFGFGRKSAREAVGRSAGR